MTVEAKFCGINDPQAMTAAVQAGAAHVGLVFFPPSPRAVSPQEAAMLAAPARQPRSTWWDCLLIRKTA